MLTSHLLLIHKVVVFDARKLLLRGKPPYRKIGIRECKKKCFRSLCFRSLCFLLQIMSTCWTQVQAPPRFGIHVVPLVKLIRTNLVTLDGTALIGGVK